MAKDIYSTSDRCAYCGRPGCVAWSADLYSCRNEVCLALAFGEVKRRTGRGLPLMRPARPRVKLVP